MMQDSNDPSIWFESARLYFYMCNFDKALDAISKTIELNSSSARYQYWAGQIGVYSAVFKCHDPNTKADAAKQIEISSKAFEQTIAIDPNCHEARFELINLYLQTSPRNETNIQKQIEEFNRIAPIWAAKAKCLLLGSEATNEKLQIWKDVVAKYNSNADAHIGLGNIYWDARKNDEALQHFKQAFDLEPQRSEILFDIARCYQEMKNYELQAKCYQQYIDSKPLPPLPMRVKALQYLAKTEERLGNNDRASLLEDQANKMDPRYGKHGAIVSPIPDFFVAP